jgi:hypothetical protein
MFKGLATHNQLTVKLGCKGVIDINDKDLPVSLTLVKESHDTKSLDLLDLTRVSNLLTNFANVNGVIVATSLSLGVNLVGVFPGLRQGTVVPDIALVGEAVADETKLALLDVLLDRVQSIFLGDLVLQINKEIT